MHLGGAALIGALRLAARAATRTMMSRTWMNRTLLG
jgi:hypothetical protein